MRAIAALLLLSACPAPVDGTDDTDVDTDDPVFGDPETDDDDDTDDTDDTDTSDDTDPDTDTSDDTDPDTDVVPDTDPLAPWQFSITVDGDRADWTPDATFTTSSGSPALITWTADNLFVGHERADVATGGGSHWMLVVVGTAAGATPPTGAPEGPQLNTQAPALPGPAALALRWKADDSYRDLLVGTSGSWVADATALASVTLTESNANQVVEARIPRSLLPSGAVWVATYWVFEGAGSESTFSAVPAGALTDGYDPDLATALDVDFTLPGRPIDRGTISASP